MASCGSSCESSVASLSDGACVLDAARKIIRNFIDVTPAPIFAWLDGTNDGMTGRVIVLGCVPVLRGIAASDMTANEAQPEVDPRVAGLHAIFADMTSGLEVARLSDMAAVCHRLGPLSVRGRGVIRISFRAISSIVRRRFFDERSVLYSMSRSDARDIGWPVVM